ncbi:MAG: helix-turn-helix domain-containing protein [Verrucomicrobiaceae bacterium]|nr:helix-turn-helix domain-containing protein [Verrucomicrobiaceae bacterium]
MKNQAIEELKSSIREAGAVRRGEKAPARVWRLVKQADGSIKRVLVEPKTYQARRKANTAASSEVTSARAALAMSQTQFAGFLGISVRTLHHWEQGSRQPSRAAQVLIQVARREPKVLKRVLAMA